MLVVFFLRSGLFLGQKGVEKDSVVFILTWGYAYMISDFCLWDASTQ